LDREKRRNMRMPWRTNDGKLPSRGPRQVGTYHCEAVFGGRGVTYKHVMTIDEFVSLAEMCVGVIAGLPPSNPPTLPIRWKLSLLTSSNYLRESHTHFSLLFFSVQFQSSLRFEAVRPNHYPTTESVKLHSFCGEPAKLPF
jgi:hypothetical protein